MSNLFAALGWALVDQLTHPASPVGWPRGRSLAERCALESTRMAQRSIMARYVLSPVTLDVGGATLDIGAARPSPPSSRSPTPARLRPRPVAPGAVEPAAAGGHVRPRGTRAGDRVRPRPSHLSGPAVLAGGHDRGPRPSAGHLRARAGLDVTAGTGFGPDRRGRPRRGTLPAHLHQEAVPGRADALALRRRNRNEGIRRVRR
jgi:hypothetical protein